MSGSINVTEIHERLARIETTQEHQSATLTSIDNKLDGISTRVRDVEMKGALHGTLAGGAISLLVAFLASQFRGS